MSVSSIFAIIGMVALTIGVLSLCKAYTLERKAQLELDLCDISNSLYPKINELPTDYGMRCETRRSEWIVYAIYLWDGGGEGHVAIKSFGYERNDSESERSARHGAEELTEILQKEI